MDGPYRVEEFGIGYCVAGLGAYITGAIGVTRSIADTHASDLNAAYAAGRESVLERLRSLLEVLTVKHPTPLKTGEFFVCDANGKHVHYEDSPKLVALVNAIAEELK